MKKYIKPSLRTLDINMESLMTAFSVVDKTTDGEALSNRKHAWSSEMWQTPKNEE